MKTKILTTLIVLLSLSTFAQVSINSDGSSPDGSAMLDVKSISSGILIPRMTSTQRTGISTPATGLLVFDNTTGSFWFYNGSAWEDLSAETIPNQIADADNDTKVQVEESADEDIIRFDLAGIEQFRMDGPRLEVKNDGGGVFIGEGAGENDVLIYDGVIPTKNTFIGHYSGQQTTEGFCNVALGNGALRTNTTGSSNVTVGYFAGRGDTFAPQSNNTIIGTEAGKYNGGNGNIYIGYRAAYDQSLANQNNRLFIENSESVTPLIYGEFDNDIVGINGKLGIGTTSPDTTLHVVGSIKMEDGNQGVGKVLTSDASGVASWQDASAISDSDWTINGADMYSAVSGNVGIGTAAPDGQLHVHTNSAGTVSPDGWTDDLIVENNDHTGISIFTPDDKRGHLQFGSPSNNDNARVTGDYNNGSPYLAFWTNSGTEQMRITSEGNAGIGTTNPEPSAKLDVNSTTQGLLPPRMTHTERDNIGTPATGLMVYNTTTNQPNYYNGSEWKNYDGTSAGTEIGFYYQGGIVAYILQSGDPGYDSDVQHGLIAAAGDQSTAAEWGCPDDTPISGADGTALGTGYQNTLDIVAGCSTTGIAARICDDLVLNDYSDWYLPSKDELNKLYINKTLIGGFVSDLYWCSTENDMFDAWVQHFGTGYQTIDTKSTLLYVRAIRTF